VRLLLDTHAFLWFIAGSTQLGSGARAAIEDPSSERLLSAASIWETAIKISIGKLTVGSPFETFVVDQMRANGIELLGILPKHCAIVVSLPFHHRDPFDRLLIAQALVEQVPIVSADASFDAYGVQRIW
jgi:PIN domain nuclease of toxin-antitoxin system